MILKEIAHSLVKTERTLKDKVVHSSYMKTTCPKEISELKDSASGKRCFVIGNGPSLKKDDLERLTEEDCFACNRIYGMYDSIKWRPKYYCSQDYKVLEQIAHDLPYAVGNCEYAFFPWNHRKLLDNIKGESKVRYFYRPYVSVYSKDGKYPEGLMPFSADISQNVYDGLSITYAMMQIAVYMGYKEIYLLGIDHNYPMKNGKVDATQSYAEGIKPIDMSTQYPPELLLCEVSFREARRHCENNGIQIYNATRGGKLEVFQRVNLEEIIKK